MFVSDLTETQAQSRFIIGELRSIRWPLKSSTDCEEVHFIQRSHVKMSKAIIS